MWRLANLAVVAVLVLALLVLPRVLQEVFPVPYAELIAEAAREHAVDWTLIAAVIQVESGFRPGVVSNKGAVGLMQLMPDTAQWLADQRSGGAIPDLADPRTNIQLGTYYLKYLLERFATEQAALAAYNGGPANVSRWLAQGTWDGSHERSGQIPFAETRSYVRKVVLMRRLYRLLYPHGIEQLEH